MEKIKFKFLITSLLAIFFSLFLLTSAVFAQDHGTNNNFCPPGSTLVTISDPVICGCSNCECNVCSYCGDGITLGGEECDDANQNLTDGCRLNCLLPFCGDGIHNEFDAARFPGTTCDYVGDDTCRLSCTKCGDGIINSSTEQCDDGNTVNDDDCTNTCHIPVCGDGIVQEGEQCDDGNTVNNDACTNTCRVPVCGDGIVQFPEQCDDANTVNNDDCTNTCTTPICGDGIVQDDEQCDDGNTVNNDACTNTCETPRCGDGITQDPEQCDDGNTVNNDACTNTCETPVCGDGITQHPEQCDDGNTVNNDACSNTCRTPICGDGITQHPEQCDDGNTVNNDACSNTCRTPICGDGVVQPGEQCDDGNTVNNDTCSNTCRTPICGDGITQHPEQCDDGNTVNNDTCSNTCRTPICGDGITQHPEQCDDGNTVNNDTCSNTCRTPRCGDGITQHPEQCDDGNTVNNDSCSNTCQPARCGDGVVQSPELCDDGNTVNNDSCSNTCQTPRCGDGIINSPLEMCDGSQIRQVYLDKFPDAVCNAQCELGPDDCDRTVVDPNWGVANCCVGLGYPEDQHGKTTYVGMEDGYKLYQMRVCMMGYQRKQDVPGQGYTDFFTSAVNGAGENVTGQLLDAGTQILEAIRGIDVDKDGTVATVDSAWGWNQIQVTGPNGSTVTRLRPAGWTQQMENSFVNAPINGTGVEYDFGFAGRYWNGFINKADNFGQFDTAFKYYGNQNVPITNPANYHLACWTCSSLRLEGCFVPETKILMADGTEKTIESISAGEEIRNPVTGAAVKVKSILESNESEPIIAISAGGKVVKVTQNHPVYTARGVITAKEVVAGDEVTLGDAKASVTSVEQLPVKADQRVINIRLDADNQLENHMVLSDGIVTGDLTAQEIINNK